MSSTFIKTGLFLFFTSVHLCLGEFQLLTVHLAVATHTKSKKTEAESQKKLAFWDPVEATFRSGTEAFVIFMPLLLVLAVVVEHCRIQIPMDLAYIFFCTLLPTDCSITHPRNEGKRREECARKCRWWKCSWAR